MREDDLTRLRAAFEAGDETARIALGDLYEARGDATSAETVRTGFLPLDRDAAVGSLVNLIDTTRRGTIVDTDPRMRPAIASPQVMLWLVLLLDAVAKPERVPALAKLPKSRRSWVVPRLLEARLRTEPTLNGADALEILGYLDSNYDDLDANELVTLILRTPPSESLRIAVRRLLRQRDLNASVLKGPDEHRLRARLESFIAG